MSTTDKASPGETPAQLSIRKGSRVAPAILLLLTIFLFILYALPSGFGQLAEGLGVSSDPSKVPTLEEVERLLTSEAKADVDKRNAVLERMKGFGPWQYVTQIGLPIVKIYLDQLAIDLAKISQNVVKTAAVLALFSLIPGLAGLIYRRNFAIWFLASFGVLLAINASGVFGSLAGAEKMLLSGTIFFFILSQIVLLLLAYRLR